MKNVIAWSFNVVVFVIFSAGSTPFCFADRVVLLSPQWKSSTNFSVNHSLDTVPPSGGLLVEQLQEITKDLKQLEARVSELREKYQKILVIADRENQLLQLKNQMERKWKGAARPELSNKFHEMVSDQVLRSVLSSYENYSTMSLEKKADTVDVLIDCYKGYSEMYDQMADWPASLERIEDAYTESVWNPFTYTYMDEIVKDDIYKVYQDILFPAFLNDIQSGLQCENVRLKMQNFDRLYQRMMELRNGDTDQLEDQINLKMTAQEIAEIFSIDWKLNSEE